MMELFLHDLKKMHKLPFCGIAKSNEGCNLKDYNFSWQLHYDLWTSFVVEDTARSPWLSH